MAKSLKSGGGHVLLGFPDGFIMDETGENFTTSKIGGRPCLPPGYPSLTPAHTTCGVCGRPTVLVTQIYAPLEASPYHRLLLVLACIQPSCWNNVESWLCLRLQVAEEKPKEKVKNSEMSASSLITRFKEGFSWSSDEEEEDEEHNGNSLNEQMEELSMDDNRAVKEIELTEDLSLSSSTSSSLQSGGVNGQGANNNNRSPALEDGAVGHQSAEQLYGTAEVEDDQDGIDVIAAESPDQSAAQASAIPSLFFSQPHSQPEVQREQNKNLTRLRPSSYFAPMYLYVEEERDKEVNRESEHETRLAEEYKVSSAAAMVEELRGNDQTEDGRYEKSVPKHGDVLFHKFVSVLQRNPGQVIRYSRDPLHRPLFPSRPPPPKTLPRTCGRCRSTMICELQLLPSILGLLSLENPGVVKSTQETLLEFGIVLIYTCQQSCWDDANDLVRREAIFVQPEQI